MKSVYNSAGEVLDLGTSTGLYFGEFCARVGKAFMYAGFVTQNGLSLERFEES